MTRLALLLLAACSSTTPSEPAPLVHYRIGTGAHDASAVFIDGVETDRLDVVEPYFVEHTVEVYRVGVPVFRHTFVIDEWTCGVPTSHPTYKEVSQGLCVMADGELRLSSATVTDEHGPCVVDGFCDERAVLSNELP